MKSPIVHLLGLFVSIRFWLLPAFVSLYYLQGMLSANHLNIKRSLLAILLIVIAVAIPANYMWIVDYRRRLTSGVKFLNSATRATFDEKDAIEQVRWSNAKLLAVVALILAMLSNYNQVSSIPIQHRVPVLATALLIFVALFDSALDLEAEWTISILESTKNVDETGKEKGTLARAIWKTNQFRTLQNELYEQVRAGKEPKIRFGSFTSTAQNVISFAVIVIFYLAVAIFVLLLNQLRGTFA